MDNTSLSKNTVSFGLALVIASLVNSLLVVAKESSTAVMNGMKNITGHHWTTHSAFILILFVVLGLLLGRMHGGAGPKLSANRFIGVLLGGVLLSGLIILGFYLIGELNHFSNWQLPTS